MGSEMCIRDRASSLSEALRVNNSLTSLDLDLNSIGVGRASSLSEASLTCLGVDLNYLVMRKLFSLSEALRVNTSLTSLDLR